MTLQLLHYIASELAKHKGQSILGFPRISCVNVFYTFCIPGENAFYKLYSCIFKRQPTSLLEIFNFFLNVLHYENVHALSLF